MKIKESHFLNASAEVNPAVLAAKQRFGIVGNSSALLGAVERAVKVAPIDLSVLVTGESGSGKEFFPKIIHNGSARRHARYIAVNCGAIPEGTIDSELFGHEKGSFTGAIATRKGYFEEADGGTIFLDEVAELPLTTQARLLRVLETGEFMKVGSSEVQKTNIRIVAATNVDLRAAIAQGTFREDLYYRLSTVQIVVPPLRERRGDIELLARYFATAFFEKYNSASFTFDDSGRRRLIDFEWPGNVRQLKNVIEQVALFESGNTVDAVTLDTYLDPESAYSGTGHVSPAGGPPASTHSYDRERELLFNMIFSLRGRVDELSRRLDALSGINPTDNIQPGAGFLIGPRNVTDEIPATTTEAIETATETHRLTSADSKLSADSERRAIEQSLIRNDGRRRAVARELGIPERTLYRKIKEYGLE